MPNEVALVNGSLSVRKKAGRVKNISRVRHFMESRSRISQSTQVLSATQSLFPVGSQFSAGTFTFSADLLSANAQFWIQQHDQYRLREVEVFATLTAKSRQNAVDRSVPVEVYFYEDTDALSNTTTSWIRVSDRDNLGRVVLNALSPTKKLMTFKPTPSFNPTSVSSDSPSNVIPSKNAFVDALVLAQQYAGMRFFTACPQTDSSGQTYEYAVNFSVRYTVEARQPI